MNVYHLYQNSNTTLVSINPGAQALLNAIISNSNTTLVSINLHILIQIIMQITYSNTTLVSINLQEINNKKEKGQLQWDYLISF